MKRIIYTTLIVISIAGNIRAQREFGHVTPTTADFIKYGEVPVSLFTGKMNFEVPIYRIKDSDFDIPISLTYTSDGFKPAKRSGFVGLDWILNVGGVITREVYGSPDEAVPDALESQEWGYLMTVQKGNYDKDKVWNFDPEVVLTDMNLGKYLKPIEGYFCGYYPDLFLFSFNGHNENFMIDNQGIPKTNIKGYKVDISNMVPQYNNSILPDQSTIKIYTPNGYEYIFGGELNALEFSINFTQGALPIRGQVRPTILAWHLTKIIAPNGRKVEFIYKETTLSDSNLNNSNPIWSSNKTSTTINPTGSAIKNVVLQSITVDDIAINFNASIEQTFLNTSPTGLFNTGYSDFNYAGYQLDGINITKANVPLYSDTLGYTNNSKRRFLSTFTQSDGGVYNFTYNHPDTGYPQPDIVGQTDTWGYWKTINDAIPTHPKDTMILQMVRTLPPLIEDTVAIVTTVEKPYSLLEKVSYPTGGFSTFTYEPNEYSLRIDQKLTSTFIERNLVPDTIPVGGFRIKKIEHYSDNNKKETEKKYFYTEDMTTSSISTGIIYQYPAYSLMWNLEKSFYADWKENYNIGEPHIGYSKVYEQNMDSSYTKYTFSDYKNNPDVDNSKISPLSVYDPDFLAATGVNRSTSNSQKRGLLYEKTIVNSLGITVSKEKNLYKNISSSGVITTTDYNYIQQPIDDYIVSFRSINGGCMATKIYLQSYPLMLTENTTNNVVRKILYSYNENDLISCQKEVDSRSDTIKTVYNYLQNFISVNNSPSDLLFQNFINYLAEKIQYKNTQHIGRQEYLYKTNTTYPLVESVKTFIGSNLLNPNITNYNIYDVFGNPVYIIKNSATRTIYLWGYKGQYPIAKIENATYDNVKNALGGILPESLSENDSFNQSLITNLRNDNVNLSNALITTYSYKPLVGLQTETDSRGVTTTYEYDTFNRLKCIKDTNGKIVKKFDYNYKH